MEKTVLNLIFSFYKYLVAPAMRVLTGNGPRCCKFSPTCSQYAIEAFCVHNIFKASYLTLFRLLRCNPWTHAAYFDPIPLKENS